MGLIGDTVGEGYENTFNSLTPDNAREAIEASNSLLNPAYNYATGGGFFLDEIEETADEVEERNNTPDYEPQPAEDFEDTPLGESLQGNNDEPLTGEDGGTGIDDIGQETEVTDSPDEPTGSLIDISDEIEQERDKINDQISDGTDSLVNTGENVVNQGKNLLPNIEQLKKIGIALGVLIAAGVSLYALQLLQPILKVFESLISD